MTYMLTARVLRFEDIETVKNAIKSIEADEALDNEMQRCIHLLEHWASQCEQGQN